MNMFFMPYGTALVGKSAILQALKRHSPRTSYLLTVLELD